MYYSIQFVGDRKSHTGMSVGRRVAEGIRGMWTSKIFKCLATKSDSVLTYYCVLKTIQK